MIILFLDFINYGYIWMLKRKITTNRLKLKMGKKFKEEKNIKAKVFISYAVIILLISSLLYFTFESFRKLTYSSDALSQPNLRIGLLHDIMFSIYHAESNIRAYTLNEQEVYLDAYLENLAHINHRVDHLYKLAGSDTIFTQTIDSINVQLLRKTRVLDQLIKIKKLEQNAVLYEKALDDIIKAAQEETRVKQVTHQTIVDDVPIGSQEYTLEEINREKENLFSRIRMIFGRKHFDTPTIEESKISREINQAQQIIQKIRTDTIITVYRDTESLKEDVENTMINLMHSILNKQRNLLRKENQILLEDKRIMDRIWDYISFLEDYESYNAIREAEKAHETVSLTTHKIFIIVIISMVVLMIFSWMFVHDMNKSHYYKKQLISERSKAEHLLHVKQRFMANISHEIRTPLNSIIGFSAQLEKVPQEEKSKTFIKAINQSSNHLLGIVNDILDFSKIEAGKIKLEHISVDLKEIASEVHDTLSILSSEKNLDFILETTAIQNPYVMADPLCLKQVLLNIAGNAVKFTSSGYVRLIFADHTNKDNPDTSILKIRVSDTGPGIPFSDQKQIFEEFAQGDNRATRKHGGTGLGLSISKKLVDLMGGKIELYSQPGKGATFSIYLPLKISEKPRITKEIAAISLPPGQMQARILVVDDDKLNRLLIRSVLSKYEGIVIKEAFEAESALELLDQQQYDLIISDIQMPGISGIEMIGQLRSNLQSPNRNTPVIACTADITSETLREIKEIGMDDYLLKPYDEGQLLKKISELIQNMQISGNAESDMHEGSDGNSLYNLNNLKAFTGNDPKALYHIIDNFIEDTKSNLQKLESFYLYNDLDGISAIAHKMSNMFGLLNSPKALIYIKKLDQAREGAISSEEIRICIDKIGEFSKELIHALNQEEMLANPS
jgi:signal transduction histidine kinase/CheY-like chemotaxis protein/CHASE3 domain sensor protein/HPt (histidine-containing phosphotransfer) domain-containing protein